MSTSVVVPTAVEIIGKALGHRPTNQELMDLAPVAVAVQAFIAGAGPGDQLTFKYEQWDRSYLLGLFESSGQEASLKIRKAKV